jgi:oxygen-independent coproporphyrinogen-3 oxidase
MSNGRAPEGEQVEMFALIESDLRPFGLFKYEISNFARPGYESRHNKAYWNDSSYWGLGLSSHSYARDEGPFGTRFWNPKSLPAYAEQVEAKATSWAQALPANQREKLLQHEALTDFCHMHLRTLSGLHEEALRHKFSKTTVAQVLPRLERLTKSGLLSLQNNAWALSPRGQLISNKVFEELTFLATELELGGLTVSSPNSYCSV